MKTLMRPQYRRTRTGQGVSIGAGFGMTAEYIVTINPQEAVARALEWFLRRPDYPLERCRAIVKRPTPAQSSIILLALKYMPQHLREGQRQVRQRNLVPAILRNSLATLISGTVVTPTFMANYIALGDDDTAPASGDLTLGNETLRDTFDDRSAEGSTAFLNKFFPSADVGGNVYQEAGIFVDGASGADTGYLLSRLLLDLTLGEEETLTLNVTFAVNAG